MPELTKTVVLRTKRGAPILENGKPKIDPKTNRELRGEPIPVTTVEMAVLTSKQAMDADDFAAASSPTGDPSRHNRLRAFALCSVRKFNKEIVLPPGSLNDYETLRDKFNPDELHTLTAAFNVFSADIEEADDPKDSPADKP